MTLRAEKPVTTDPSYTSLGGHWCTIESTPTVFNALVMKNGIRETHVKEVWSLEPEIFNALKNDHVYGFIFLLRPQEGRMSKYEELLEPTLDTSEIYFANQVIPDACGTQALLSIAMNCPEMEIGPMLNEFKEFTAKFEPKARLAMTNCRQLRENHNSLCDYYERDPVLPLPFLVEVNNEEGEEEDQFHYVAYVHVDGYLWELDGLQPGPLRRMACTRENWLDVARIEFKARMMTYEEGEDRFVLMAVVKDPLVKLRARLERLRNGEEKEKEEEEEEEEGNDNTCPNEEDGGDDQNNNSNYNNFATGNNNYNNNNQTREEIKEVESEIGNIIQEREAEKREIREMEADFRESINIFMKALVQLEAEDEMMKKKKKSKKRKRK
ncbi:ubiquitin carboxyl-terminal hydrolase [Entomortierella chlamydospora]|uniref:Ubiquitin carboxyl-terminal hydrolase n=1 Tax=Entomortierella chlamydospora TaxID=101097 RepID=A0A9P6N1X1_9FUNG|nr:ubiquitin carboxyl-terminal hydrolase [Entomortierella chlamydospora]KAG0022098.1 ubiquitin carboxyl-terminal hydrolase [Entomortierella chlamydospora]